MSGEDEFFAELGKRTVGNDDRLMAELRAHLEDAGEAGLKSLGNTSEIATLFNRVRFEREGPVWILSTILLGTFALVVQLLTAWLMIEFWATAGGHVTELPIDEISLSPGQLLATTSYALAFPWIYLAFVVCARRAFTFVGQTRWSIALGSWLVLLPTGANVLSRLLNPMTQRQIPLYIVNASVLALAFLVAAAWLASRRAISFHVPRWARTTFWVALLLAIVLTSIGFGMRDGDGALAIEYGLPLALFPLLVVRQLFESAMGSTLAIFLGFLSPPAMWNLIGATLSAWWIYGILSVANRLRRREKGFPWAGVVTMVYLTSILSAGATDVPDVEFHVPVSSVSLRIEQSEIRLWPNLHRYFGRTNNVFPFYHAAWDGKRGEFLVEQSQAKTGMYTLFPVGQWYVRTSGQAGDAIIRDTGNLDVQPGGYGIRENGTSITPPEPDDDDTTLDVLAANGIHCDTDEPFPSCFTLSYGTKEIFSHATRSVNVTQAIVTPDRNWMLLTLTTRYGGNEYVYLVDLR